jgi:hypothetical protein
MIFIPFGFNHEKAPELKVSSNNLLCSAVANLKVEFLQL